MKSRILGHDALTPLRRPGLGLKLLVIVVAVSLVGVVVSSLLVLALQRQQLMASAQHANNRLSNAIEASLAHSMLHHDRISIQQAVEAVVGAEDAEVIRILDVTGQVQVSSRTGEIGQRLAHSSAECQLCHANGELPSSGTMHLTTPGGQERLLNVKLIRNQPSCYGCHDPRMEALGLLMVERPLSELQGHMAAAIPRLGLTALVTFAFLAALMLLALRKLVTRPIAALADGLAQVGAGNLDAVVQVNSSDELGDLAAALDSMRRQLKASMAEIERRNRALSILNDLALAAGQTLDLQEVMDLALDTAVNRLGMQAGLIYLHDPETGSYLLRASRGATPEQCAEITRRRQLHPSLDIARQVASAAKVFFAPRMADDHRHRGIWSHQDRRSFINVPLKSRGAAVGSMGLVSRVDQVLSEQDAQVLEAVGHEIGIAIDNALLYERVRHMAALEERDRLAREMHDNLAQSLGYLHLKASMADTLLEGGRIEEARQGLAEIKSLSSSAYRDVREAIFGLRAAASSGAEFLPALRKYVEAYRSHYGVHAELQVQGETLADLPEDTVVQITRIIQEALTNVRRHAGTDRARVRIAQEQGWLEIAIEDDGRGFDPAQVAAEGRQCFGLQVMHERAASVGGEVVIKSQPGEGTRVLVRVPLGATT